MIEGADTSMTIRVNSKIKHEAQELFSSLGMDMSTAINVYLRRAVAFGGIPFMVEQDIPNRKTIKAIKEVQELEKNPNKKTYGSFAELLEDLDN